MKVLSLLVTNEEDVNTLVVTLRRRVPNHTSQRERREGSKSTVNS